MPILDGTRGLAPSTRRDLLKAGLMAGIAAVIPVEAVEAAVRPAAAAAPAPGAAVPAALFRSTFTPLLGERFGARGSTAPVALRLAAVRDLPHADRLALVDSEDCFSLRFDGPARRPLAQGTYTLWHASLGAFPLFLVPMGLGRQGRVLGYEAVINRPPQA
jgi:hypothetical protein